MDQEIIFVLLGMEKSIKYSNEEVTIVWKPEVCIHAAKCVQKLPDVFKPKDKPWIQMENASSDAIVDAVRGCPSGALTYFKNESGQEQSTAKVENETTKVEVIENGPLMVFGSLVVKYADGSEEQKSRVTAFCRCGRTENKPYCDGSHKKQLLQNNILMDYSEAFNTNRETWNKKVAIHAASDFYDLENFRKVSGNFRKLHIVENLQKFSKIAGQNSYKILAIK